MTAVVFACLWWLVKWGAVGVCVCLVLVVAVLILAPLWEPDPRRTRRR